MEKGVFLQNSNFYWYLIQFLSKFHETLWLYCSLKVSSCALVFLFMCFYNLTLCHEKRWVLVKFQFLLISDSVFVKISWNFIVILCMKSFTMFTCLLIYEKLCNRKRVLNVFYFRFWFLDSQIKHVSVSLTDYHSIPHFDTLKIHVYIAVENIVREGEIVCLAMG